MISQQQCVSTAAGAYGLEQAQCAQAWCKEVAGDSAIVGTPSAGSWSACRVRFPASPPNKENVCRAKT